MTLKIIDALNGALVSDAACMGLHWMYDQDQLKAIESTGDLLFRAPDKRAFENQKAFFAHAAKQAGELSHYGESARIVAQLALDDAYSTANHRQAFAASFGPCGSYEGYADRPTKALIAKIILEDSELQDPSGTSDDQMPALCVVPGLFAAGAQMDTIQEAAGVISTHEHIAEGVTAIVTCLQTLQQGQSLQRALRKSIEVSTGELANKLEEALDWPGENPLEVAEHFGLACKVYMGLPVAWYLLKHAEDFESLVRDNIRCGGDTCGRSMILGAIAGFAMGIPPSMIAQLKGGRVPINV